MHDTAKGLLVLMLLLPACWLFAQSHANSRQAGSSCIVCLGLAKPSPARGPAAKPKTGRAARGLASSLMRQSCSDIAVEGGERERDNGQTAEFVSLTFWP